MRYLGSGRNLVVVFGVLLAVLIVAVTGAMGPAKGATDLPGNNINNGWDTHANSKEECAELCDTNPSCFTATYGIMGLEGPEDPRIWQCLFAWCCGLQCARGS